MQQLRTLNDLKKFLLKCDDITLQQAINIAIPDQPVHILTEVEATEEDVYYNTDDPEDDCGTLESLKEIHGPDFDITNYKIGTSKGTIIFF